MKLEITIIQLGHFIFTDIYEYKEFIVLLKSWKEDIINSFTALKRDLKNSIVE